MWEYSKDTHDCFILEIPLMGKVIIGDREREREYDCVIVTVGQVGLSEGTMGRWEWK
jgi:hypothetical protein